MFISRFNRLFDRHGKTIYFFLLIIISLAFVFFMTPGAKPGGGRGRRKAEVGTMYGAKIDSEEFLEAITATDITVFLKWGQFLSENRRMADYLIEETLRRIRSLREARIRGLDQPGDREVMAEIQKQRVFQKDDAFSKETFSIFQERILARKGLDGKDFDEIMRENILIERLESQVKARAFVSEQEVKDEYERLNEEFTISYHEFNRSDFAEDPELEPSTLEVETYFEEHRDALRLPPSKKCRIVTFHPEDAAEKITVTEEEIQKHYEIRGVKRKFDKQGRSLEDEDVKQEITDLLIKNKSRRQVLVTARTFSEELKSEKDTESDRNWGEIFAERCKQKKLKYVDSTPFSKDDPIPEFPEMENLARKAYELTELLPVSNVIYDSGNYYVACWLETIPGDIPEELTDNLTEQIKNKILEQEAREFYATKVEPYRPKLADGETPQDLIQSYTEKLREMEDKSPEELQELRAEKSRKINDCLQPYYVPIQKRVLAVVFKGDDYLSEVEVNEKDIETYYEANISEYSKEEIRARKILVRAPPKGTDEEKAEKRKELEKILDRIREGEQFSSLAGEQSEDYRTRQKGGDMGYFAAGQEEKAVDEVVFDMEVGEISPIVEAPSGFLLFKLVDRRDGRSLEEVSAEIRTKLRDERADSIARKTAEKFASAAYLAVDEAPDGASVSEIFSKIASDKDYTVQLTDWFRERGMVKPIGWDTTLAKEAHRVSELNPVSEIIDGKEGWYVVCHKGTKKGHIPELDEDPTLITRLKAQMKREKEVQLARKRGENGYGTISEKLTESGDWDTASEGIEFETSDAFTVQSPPSGIPGSRDIVDALADAAPGKLLEPIETPAGAVLVYLVSRELPQEVDDEGESATKSFEDEKESIRNRLVRQKQNDLLTAFHKRLEEESDTELNERWKNRM